MESNRKILPFRISHPIVSGIWYAFLWMMIGALILSICLRISELREDNLTVYTYLIHAVSIACGGIVAGKRTGRRGWYQGALIGFIYGLIVLLISFLALDSSLTLGDLGYLIPAMLIGAVGGVMGVNLNRN
ncbi:putative membrane protein (TIGR04086 family) [Paenibacillus shirakamiensis]|uniref:Membrane protein (TIGR04086 family) n=1 Tax=Paenibacillus shirakamiensis TaxID=1265935 RepID=A0ABS4JDH6_9BACL|nr:TIGR04086 family membrane protein [Paenibacillus shirakamiensis]MBP1999001.1 putative membrane protein (TIGR04086 family) [Paenibacillus shirakamiensis]